MSKPRKKTAGKLSPRIHCWSIAVKSESGDDYGPHLFDHKPDDDELEKFLRELSPCDWPDDPDDLADGPGFRGSYLHVDGPIEHGAPTRRSK